MSKYNRKQQQPTQDEFVSFWAKAFQRVEPYLRTLGLTLGTSVVIVVIAWVILGYRTHKAEDAAEQFSRVVRIYEADLLTDDKAKDSKAAEANAIPRFKTEKERTDATLAELDKLERDFGGPKAARQLFRAGVLYDAGRFDEAQSAFQSVIDDGRGPAVVLALAREGLALCDEARGKIDDALAKFKALEPKTGDFYRDRALYGAARMHVKKGEKKNALELLKQAIEKMPTTPLKEEMQAQVALIEQS